MRNWKPIKFEQYANACKCRKIKSWEYVCGSLCSRYRGCVCCASFCMEWRKLGGENIAVVKTVKKERN